MVSDVAAAGVNANPSPFNISLFESCTPAKNLLKTASHIAEFGSSHLIDYLSTFTTNTTTVEQFRKKALVHISNLAMRNSNVSNILLNAFEKYEYPEGRNKWWLPIYNFLFVTEESSLPPCQFDSLKPVNRERYVYCNQLLNYFSAAHASEICRVCYWLSPDFKYNPTALDSIGSYILSAELTHPPDPLVEVSSWTYRADWDKNLREQFCQSESDRDYYWKQTLCKDNSSSLPPKKERSFKFWNRVIKPQIDSNKDVFPTTVNSELSRKLYLYDQAFRNFITKAHSLQPTLDRELKAVANSFIKSREATELLNKILNGATRLKSLMRELSQTNSLETWNELQDEIKLLDFNLDRANLPGQFNDIKNTLLKAKAYQKPSNEPDGEGFHYDEL